MQNIFCSNCFSSNPWFSKCYIFWNVLIKVMADHLYECIPKWELNIHNAYWINSSIIFSYQHVKMLIYSVGSIRPRGVCRWWQDMFHTTHFDDIWSMTTTSTFTVQNILRKLKNCIKRWKSWSKAKSNRADELFTSCSQEKDLVITWECCNQS